MWEMFSLSEAWKLLQDDKMGTQKLAVLHSTVLAWWAVSLGGNGSHTRRSCKGKLTWMVDEQSLCMYYLYYLYYLLYNKMFYNIIMILGPITFTLVWGVLDVSLSAMKLIWADKTVETVTEARLDMMYDLWASTWNFNESASDDDEANGLSKLLNTDLTCNHSLDQQVDHFIGCLEFNFASLSAQFCKAEDLIARPSPLHSRTCRIIPVDVRSSVGLFPF